MSRFFLTTAIDYVNSRPHLGTAYEKILTDVIARYLRTLYTHARLLVLGPLRRVPVLLVCGDRDVLTPLTHTREIAAVLPEAELVVVADGGHVVMLEHADEVNEAIEEFLKRVIAP